VAEEDIPLRDPSIVSMSCRPAAHAGEPLSQFELASPETNLQNFAADDEIHVKQYMMSATQQPAFLNHQPFSAFGDYSVENVPSHLSEVTNLRLYRQDRIPSAYQTRARRQGTHRTSCSDTGSQKRREPTPSFGYRVVACLQVVKRDYHNERVGVRLATSESVGRFQSSSIAPRLEFSTRLLDSSTSA
jgi:hypothetical protein